MLVFNGNLGTWLRTQFTASCAVRKLISLMRSHLFIFTFISIALGEWKEDMVHTYSRILLSHEKEWNKATCSNMDRCRDDHTGWSQPEKDKYMISPTHAIPRTDSFSQSAQIPNMLICLDTLNLSESCSVVPDSLLPHELYSPWNFPGQNTGVGSHSLLQGIFQTQESNWGLLHCRWIL